MVIPSLPESSPESPSESLAGNANRPDEPRLPRRNLIVELKPIALGAPRLVLADMQGNLPFLAEFVEPGQPISSPLSAPIAAFDADDDFDDDDEDDDDLDDDDDDDDEDDEDDDDDFDDDEDDDEFDDDDDDEFEDDDDDFDDDD